MSYTVEEVIQLVQSLDGVATLLEAVDTRDGGEIETPIILQVISGCYSKSDENAILSAVQFMIDSHKNKLKFEQYKGTSDTDPVCQMYLKYIEKGELMYNIIKICLEKHRSTNPVDKNLCNVLYTILATSIPGAW